MDGQDPTFAGFPDPFGRGGDPGEGARDLLRVMAPRVGQDDGPAHAVKKGDAELLFEQPHLMAYRRWSNAQFSCCKREGAKPCSGFKRAYGIERRQFCIAAIS